MSTVILHGPLCRFDPRPANSRAGPKSVVEVSDTTPGFFPVILTYNSSTLVAKARVALPVNIDICKLFFPSLESSQTHPQLSGEVILPQPARQSPSAPISVENRVAWKTVMLLSAGGLDTK
jgi:hypothetical protein